MGTQTVRSMLTLSLQQANVIQAGEIPSSDDINLALQLFDNMIDSWSADRLMIYEIQPYIFNINGGQQTYLLGPGKNILTYGAIISGSSYIDGTYINVPIISLTGTGTLATATITVLSGAVTSVQVFNSNATGVQQGYGYNVGDSLTCSNTNLGGAGSGFSVLVGTVSPGDWIVPRPMSIEQMYNIWNSGTPQEVDIPIEPSNDAQFAGIAVKNTPSTFPFTYYDDGAFPERTIYMWPIPTVSLPVRVWLRQPLVDFTNIDQVVNFPPGYSRAFQFNLTVEIAAFWGKTLPPEVLTTAVSSRLAIAKTNTVPQYSMADGGCNTPRRRFNWITGGFSNFGPSF